MNKITIAYLAGIIMGACSMGLYSSLRQNDIKTYDDGPVIMWNDDWESIPVAGELVEIEEVTMDTVYVGPLGE